MFSPDWRQPMRSEIAEKAPAGLRFGGHDALAHQFCRRVGREID
jgi:hypothetical protein